MNQIAAHAACMAAGLRDSLRAAQFYAQDLTKADGGNDAPDRQPTVLSRTVAAMARTVDGSMSRAADISVRNLSPKWRSLPSPFDLATRERLALALTGTQATLSSEFTLYFFRAARQALAQWVDKPHFVLEHRIEAVRRNFQPLAKDFETPMPDVLARLVIALVEARPIARAGAPKRGFEFLKSVDLNIAVFSTACLALLLAQQGKINAKISDDEFLGITGQLIHTHLASLSAAIQNKDAPSVARAFQECMSDY